MRDFALLRSLLRNKVEVEPEILEHVAQVECSVGFEIIIDQQVGHLAGFLETCFFEVRVEFVLRSHSLNISCSRATLHEARKD